VVWVPSYCFPTSKDTMTEVTVREGQDRVNHEAGPSEVQNIAFFHQVRLVMFPPPPPGSEKS